MSRCPSTTFGCPPSHHCPTECFIGQALDGLCVGFILTTETGEILWCNRAAARALSIDPADARNRPLADVLADERLRQLWRDALNCEQTLMCAASMTAPHPLELKINFTHWGNADRHGRAMLFCDVTQERQVQLELSQAVASRLMDFMEDRTPASGAESGALTQLTRKEQQALACLGRGCNNDAIAAELGVSASTVRSHLKNAYRKLGLQSRAEAVRFAVRCGLS